MIVSVKLDVILCLGPVALFVFYVCLKEHVIMTS